MVKKRALLVAINDYPGSQNDLQSCLNDLTAMEQTIADDFGFASIVTLKDSDATVAKVEAGLKELFKDASSGDQLLFFYSGHGTQIHHGTLLEEALYLYDGTLLDDKLVDLAKGLPFGVLTVFLDSCFSGGMEKRILELDGRAEVARTKWAVPETTEKLVALTKAEATITAYKPFGCAPIKSKPNPQSFAKAQVKAAAEDSDEGGQLQLNGLLIAASRELETASASTFATMGLSAFTFCFRNALSDAKTASVNYLVKESDRLLKANGFSQTPIVKSLPGSLAGLAFLSAVTGSKAFGGVVGGGGVISTPLGGGSVFIQVGVDQKIFGIDDAILIPAIAGVITAAINSRRKSLDDKIFGIDDSILVPLVASVITAALNNATKDLEIAGCGGFGGPFVSGGFSGGISIKAPELAAGVVQSIRKNNPEKIFGIDDAILIPAVAGVISAAISAASKGIGISVGGGIATPIGGGSLVIGVNAKSDQKVLGVDNSVLLQALVSLLSSALNAGNQPSAKSFFPYPSGPCSCNESLRPQFFAGVAPEKALSIDGSVLRSLISLLNVAQAG